MRSFNDNKNIKPSNTEKGCCNGPGKTMEKLRNNIDVLTKTIRAKNVRIMELEMMRKGERLKMQNVEYLKFQIYELKKSLNEKEEWIQGLLKCVSTGNENIDLEGIESQNDEVDQGNGQNNNYRNGSNNNYGNGPNNNDGNEKSEVD